ncbi:MAG: tetratricopeptide repeat protein [Chloroflexi bacterium]|nr:tetratricopeptide repeat protein [Chloroflexota bacterium]
MYIKRDYSEPFFGRRRKRGGSVRKIVVFSAFIAALLIFVQWQFDRLQLVALDIVGMAPTPTPFASEIATQGYQRWLAGDLTAAETLFAQAVAQQPNNPDYLYEYGRTMHERLLRDFGAQADFTPVIDLGDRLITAAPADPRGYAIKARALFYNGDAASAIPVGINGLEVNDQYAGIHAALAMSYVDIGRYQQGLNHGELAVELDPMDALARRSLAYVLIFLGRRQEAIDQLEQAVALLPNQVNAYFELAAQYLAPGVDLDTEGVATYERILALEPRNVRAMVRLCAAYIKVGLFDQARGYCEDALAIEPTYALAWQQLGELSFRRRNYEGAIEAYNQCRQFVGEADASGNFIQCWYVRGLAHYYLGNCEAAWTDLQDALRILTGNGDTTSSVVQSTRDGLSLVTQRCAAYSGQLLPTAPAPTVIPTPLGG